MPASIQNDCMADGQTCAHDVHSLHKKILQQLSSREVRLLFCSFLATAESTCLCRTKKLATANSTCVHCTKHFPAIFFHKKSSSCLQERTGRCLSTVAVSVTKVTSSSCVLIGKAPLCLLLLLFVLLVFVNHTLLSPALVLFAVLLQHSLHA
jgi:hypothetical protein